MIDSMTAPEGLERRTITIPASTAKQVSERVGPREFSAYVAEATAEKLRLDAMRDLLQEIEAEHGPTSQAEIDRVLKSFE